jgi:hypothetical protein
MPPIPWVLILLTVLGFIFCVVPGIVCYFLLIQKARRFENLVVTAYPVAGGTEIQITYPTFATDVVSQFTRTLPPLEIAALVDRSSLQGEPTEEPDSSHDIGV